MKNSDDDSCHSDGFQDEHAARAPVRYGDVVDFG